MKKEESSQVHVFHDELQWTTWHSFVLLCFNQVIQYLISCSFFTCHLISLRYAITRSIDRYIYLCIHAFISLCFYYDRSIDWLIDLFFVMWATWNQQCDSHSIEIHTNRPRGSRKERNNIYMTSLKARHELGCVTQKHRQQKLHCSFQQTSTNRNNKRSNTQSDKTTNSYHSSYLKSNSHQDHLTLTIIK